MSFESRVREQWPAEADKILAVVRGTVDLMEFKSVSDWVRQCYHDPSRIEQKMRAMDEILDGHGTEAIFGDDDPAWPDMEYVNMGDTYLMTILYDYTKSKFYAMPWGEWVEQAEAEGRTYP
jgi:hypothetical protein